MEEQALLRADGSIRGHSTSGHRKLLKLGVAVGGLLIALSGPSLGLVYLLIGLAGQLQKDSDITPVVVVSIALAVLSLLLGGALAWQGFAALHGRPSSPFHPPSGCILIPLFLLASLMGQTVLSLNLLPPLTLPPFHLLSTALPVLIVLSLVGRRLAGAGVRWREVILQMGSGAFLSPVISLVIEGMAGAMIAVTAFTAIAVLPGGPEWLQNFVTNLQDPAWTADPDNIRQLILAPPVLITLLMIFIVVAPLVEEAVKPLGVVLMGYRRPTRPQAFLWGVAAGAGFAIAEGLFNSTVSLEAWGLVVALRVGASAMHCLTSGLTALGLWSLGQTRRPWLLLGLYGLGVGMHALWNTAAVGMAGFSLLALSGSEAHLALGGMGIILVISFLVVMTAGLWSAIWWVSGTLKSPITT